MPLRFQFRRYRLPFRAPIRTAHGPWSEREGVIVRLDEVEEGGAASVGYGEAAPIPWFGTETVDEVEMGCRAIGEWIERSALERVPVELGCLRHALRSALEGVESRVRDESDAMKDGKEKVGGEGRCDVSADFAADRRVGRPVGSLPDQKTRSPDPHPRAAGPGARSFLSVAALLPAGRAALAHIGPQADVGFRVFKWKVGVADLADELALLDDVCAELPSAAKLRLDANGAWDRRRAERWLERCADRPVEYVEQPCFAPASQGEASQRKTEDILLGLAGDYPTPIALDESLVGERDLERWIGAGWPGIYVVKPCLVADLPSALAQLRKATAHVVFSSALETAVGAKSALQAAFAWQRQLEAAAAAHAARTAAERSLDRDALRMAATSDRRARALGFGVWPLFADARFDGPAAAPFVRQEDVDGINAESIWNALS